MEYIKDIDKYQIIKEGYNQIFIKGFNKSLISQPILEKVARGKIDEVDKSILRSLLRFKFLTKKQIEKMEGIDSSEVERRISYLVKNSIINGFKLVKIEDIKEDLTFDNEELSDALVFYCLDFGGKTVLSVFDKISVEEFSITLNVTDSYHVGRNYFAVEAAIKMKETCPNKIINVGISKVRNIAGRKIVKPLIELTMGSNISPKYKFYLFDLVRKEDVMTVFPDIAEKYSAILGSKAWKKYYDINSSDKKPMLILVCEDLETIQTAISVMQGHGYGMVYRFMLEEEFLSENLVESSIIIKHEFETGVIKRIKTPIFDPSK